MIEIEKIKSLLNQTKIIVDNQHEMAALRGENFNVFSILKMERKENETHSAFIEELLNPKGSHLMGDVFLNLFLQQIEYRDIDNFDLESAETKVEHHISTVDNESKEGGRIDILIKDGNNLTISIENKIDAGDQEFQIERYTNFNKGNNTVYYLTKFGLSASEYSKGELEENIDYFCISYKDTVRGWLENCLKEATQQPILRESIRQYIILIQKITNTMENSQEKQLNNLMISNYAEAEFIASNFDSLRNEIRDSVRNAVIKSTNKQLEDSGFSFKGTKGSKITNPYAQIWYNNGSDKFSYGVESFSGQGHLNGAMFVGVYVKNIVDLPASIEKKSGWHSKEPILNEEGKEINFSNSDLLIRLHYEKEYKKELVENMTTQIMKFIQSNLIF
ncbi:MAG: hypothetical protein ACI9YE_003616 [Psychroserpens sp.]|jgi:hypothetical protein